MSKAIITQMTDDLDGSADATEITFTYQGVDYTIDLAEKNAAGLDKALARYIKAATVLPRTTRRAKAPKGGRPSGTIPKADLSAIRMWARENGYDISNRGRIAQPIRAEYETAMAAAS